jgi:hypothetical protein
MTRLELLTVIIGRARSNGFEFRRWYTARMGVPWISPQAALVLLDGQRRYYSLIFSHEFAQAFWKAGSEITFDVPEQVFERAMPDGTRRTIRRQPFMRRSLRPNAWRYHLREMALAEEPLRYLRKYLHIEDDLQLVPTTPDEPKPNAAVSKGRRAASPASTQLALRHASRKRGAVPRAMPTGTPAFLRRPYLPEDK